MEKENHTPLTLFWFRRDLRLDDNAGLYHALKSAKHVQPLFVFDSKILDDLTIRQDRRVNFIYETIERLKAELISMGSDLWVFYGDPLTIFANLIATKSVAAIFSNRDYEPYAKNRDASIKQLCEKNSIPFVLYKDQVIFEQDEVVKADGKPYTVFTPYMQKWKNHLKEKPFTCFNTNEHYKNLNKQQDGNPLLSLHSLGFEKTVHGVADPIIQESIIKNYHKTRDDLSLESGTSQLSVHLRFGTLSIRKLFKKALDWNETYLNELIWREFYMQILWHFPTVVTQSFKSPYDNIPWNQNPEDFEKWCSANTGYPIVDAAMNQLLQTGFMHNRARMIVASFLTKHLLIDWRKGEAFFAQHLTDYELSSNNGGWQWAASSGCDAVPYFRIFNPYIQAEKFDKNHVYTQKWNGTKKDSPMIAHKIARERCLMVYKKALSNQ